MNFVKRRSGELFAEGVSVAQLAQQYGTPLYVYSKAEIEAAYLSYRDGMKDRAHLICYAVKANSNLAVLGILARLGAGFDIVSAGELARVIRAGGNPEKVVFSGVAKSCADIEAGLEAGILCFNVESLPELERIQELASSNGIRARVSVRVNPDVDAQTHPYISTGLRENKFGINIDDALEVYQRAAAMSQIDIVGIDFHIGSQLTTINPFVDALQRAMVLVDTLQQQGVTLEHIDVGGGLGVRYKDEQPPRTAAYLDALLRVMHERDQTLIIEPGRSIVANAGVLLTQVEYLKDNGDKHFAIVDAAMNDMIRPALYSAWLDIIEVQQGMQERHVYDVVGPVCETGDFLGKDRELAISAGDLLLVASSGAYGFTMASNYNSRCRAAEVMVDGNDSHLVRARESVVDLFRGESLLPDSVGT